MRPLMLRLWKDDCGALLTAEWLFLATLIVVGLVAGLKTIQNSVAKELADVGNATGALCQSYSFTGMQACCPPGGFGFAGGGFGIDPFNGIGADPNFLRFNLDSGRFFSGTSPAGFRSGVGGFGGGSCFASTCGSSFVDSTNALDVRNIVPAETGGEVIEVPTTTICPD